LLLSAVAAPVLAQSGGDTVGANFSYRKDYDSTSLTFCRLVGQNSNPRGGPIAGTARIKTVGSSVTVTAVTAGQLPFAALGVDDVILVSRPGANAADYRVIATKTDGDNITVDVAVDWSASATGFEFRWLDDQCGTTDNDGWIETAGNGTKNVKFMLEQISGVTGGIDFDIECRGGGVEAAAGIGSTPTPMIVHPGASGSCAPGTSAGGFCNFTTAGKVSGRIQVAIPPWVTCDAVRVGVAIHTSDAAEPTEADKERITITLTKENQ
jgi:hypothetical protein